MISICIPCYEFKGVGAKYVYRLLNSIFTQSFKDFEVVINDQSYDDSVSNVCKKFDVRYFSDKEGIRSNSGGINNALKHASGHIIKPMWQDDWFNSTDALQVINESLLNSDKRWGACSTIHFYEETNETKNIHTPHIDGEYYKNMKIGAPTNVFFLKTEMRFDENLIWYMDCEFYYRLYLRYGTPIFINDPLVVNCVSKYRISSDSELINDVTIQQEETHINLKYNTYDRNI